MSFLLVFAMGVVAGLRAMTPLAVISWAVSWRWLNLEGTWLAFLGATATPYLLSLLALGEIINDKLPKTPSRKATVPFAVRVIVGALSGLALTHLSWVGAGIGAIGAVCGTLGGYEARTGIVKALGCPDWPVALGEDVIAVGCGFLIASRIA
jgi:uncharacterized membrane protein